MNMNKSPQNILLIINPVSGRMRSAAGLHEILDELYRDDHAEYILPLTESEEANTPPPNRTTPPQSASAPRSLLSTGSSGALGGALNPNRRVTVVPTMYRGHASELAAMAAEEGYDTVVCCGGDGTFNETVEGLMTLERDQRPVVGYIPAGSTNDFATSVGLTGSLREAARVTVGSHLFHLDVGHFCPLGLNHLPARHFTYIASFGAFTSTSYSTSQAAKNLFGHLAYLVAGVKDIGNIQPHHAAFDLPDGTHLEGDYIFGAVANTTSAGGVLKLPSDAVSLSDGLMELFLIHMPRTPLELQRIAMALLAQDIDGCPLIELHHVQAVKILMDKNLSWSLDGEEALGGRRIEIRCNRRAIDLKTRA